MKPYTLEIFALARFFCKDISKRELRQLVVDGYKLKFVSKDKWEILDGGNFKGYLYK